MPAQSKRGDEYRVPGSEPTLRIIMRRLREIMAEGIVGQDKDGQDKLDKIVRLIAGVMVTEVCSIYLKRQDGTLELFATEGLNPAAVHETRLKRGEGLVGHCAELVVPINESDARNHPFFSYRPETSEEIFHSLLAVPIQRSAQVLGVLVVQNRAEKEYSDEDVEVLQATAMVVAEHLVSGAVPGSGAALEFTKSLVAVLRGEPMSDGIALGHVFLYQPRIVVTQLMADDPVAEMRRLEVALVGLRTSLDGLLDHADIAATGEHRDVLETYRMFAHDRGWERRLREAVEGGLTAGAAVERVQNGMRARMLRQNDPYWRERQRDLDDLSDRLLRILAGRGTTASPLAENMPPDAILVARTLGPAELVDCDRSKLRGLVIEDGSGQSHVAIVARAMGIPAIGQVKGVIERVAAGDAVILDAEAGEVHLRPSSEVIASYADKVRFRARRQRRYRALREKPAVTKDGVGIGLHINAGLLADMPHLAESGADGVGLFRTELMFMLSRSLPKLSQQVAIYRTVLTEAAGKPVVFRTLDIGGDKKLPYLRHAPEDNPALGWRAVRMALDRPALMRYQLRALLTAAAGQDLRVMIPMITATHEVLAVKALLAKELEILRKHDRAEPRRVLLGTMLEVPSLLFELDMLLPEVDFISVGSNDLLQFLFASDRGNSAVAGRYDSLSSAPLRALKVLEKGARKHRVPVTVCGEMAGKPLEAMALIGLGFRAISMAPASVGPVKAMVLSLNVGRLKRFSDDLLKHGRGALRTEFERFAVSEGIEI